MYNIILIFATKILTFFCLNCDSFDYDSCMTVRYVRNPKPSREKQSGREALFSIVTFRRVFT